MDNRINNIYDDNIIDNYSQEYSNNIRKPDPIKVERLIDDNNYIYNNYNYSLETNQNITNVNINDNNYDNDYNDNNEFDPDIIYQKELNDALEISKKEFEEIEIPKQNQIKEQLDIINSVKNKLNKLLSFDKDNKYYYETILTILEMYTNNYIQIYYANEVEKSELFKLLKQTRLTKHEFELLENIIK